MGAGTDLKARRVRRGDFTKDEYFAIPAYPRSQFLISDCAGDTLRGRLNGYLASQEKLDRGALRRAMIFGSVMAIV